MHPAPPWYLSAAQLGAGLARSPVTYRLMGCHLQYLSSWAAGAAARSVSPAVAGEHARQLLGSLPVLRQTLRGTRPTRHGWVDVVIDGAESLLRLMGIPVSRRAGRPVPYAETITPATVLRAAAHYGHGFAYSMLHAPWADARLRRLGGWLKPGHLTVAQLQRIAPSAKVAKLQEYVGPLNAMFDEFHLDTPYRVAAFLGNAIVESDHLKTFTEYASGEEYEGRTDLGNTHAGDGKKFKGRGIIQVTGRTNYAKCGQALGQDLIAHPELLASDTGLAIRSGGWYWTTYKDLNRFADKGPDGFAETVYRVNGAVTAPRTHWPERVAYYKRALRELGAQVPDTVGTDYSGAHKKKH